MYVAFIDLDDTLLDNNKQISDFTYKILVEFQEQGNILVLTTARSKQLHGLQERLKTITPYFIYHNGGEIYSQGVLLYQKFFDSVTTKRIGEYLTKKSIKAAVIMDDEYYANYNAPKVWGKIHNFHYTAFDEVEFKAPKFSIVLDSKAQKRDMDILKKYGQVIYLDNFSSAIIAPENVSKGTAIRLFLEKEKALKEKTTIYIGNDHNDISGFEACDIKIAVANADKIILRSADHIIGGNQNEGVAYYLKELLK